MQGKEAGEGGENAKCANGGRLWKELRERRLSAIDSEALTSR